MSTQVKKRQIDTNIINGWTPADETWTYASANTITVPTGAASRYQIGDKIRWTQTTVKYGVIIAVADTLLTIAVNTDYTVANAAISANQYSHQDNPIGFPPSFNYTPTYTGFTASVPNLNVSYTITGRIVFMRFAVYGHGTSNATTFTATIVGTPIHYEMSPIGVTDNGTGKVGFYQIDPSATKVDIFTSISKAAFVNSGDKSMFGNIIYRI